MNKQISEKIIGRPQTERNEDLAQIIQEPISAIARGLTPNRIANIVDMARRGRLTDISDLAVEMLEKNTHLYSEISKRQRSITMLDWKLDPPPSPSREEERDTAMLEEILRDEFQSHWLNGMIHSATDAVLKGFSNQEIIWTSVNDGSSGQLILPSDVQFVSQRAFMLDEHNRNHLLLRGISGQGIPLRPYSWIQHRSRALSGYVGDMPLTRVLVWPFIFSVLPTRDLMEFLEVYGRPPIVGRYPVGATDAEKNTLRQAIQMIGHDARGMVPHGMEIEFNQAVAGGSDQYLSVIKWTEHAISKAILGGTLSSQTDDTGARSLGEVHDAGRLEIRNSDIKELEPTINRDLIYPLWMFNAKSYDNPRRRPRFSFDTNQAEDLQVFSTALPSLVQIGMRIPLSWAHDKLQIPEADEGEAILQAPESNPFDGLNFAGLSSEKVPTIGTKDDDEGQTILDELIGEITPEQYQSMIDPIIEPVLDALKAGGVVAAQGVIKELYSDMDAYEMEKLITRACFISEVVGMNYAENN